jgi:hypothetical protein
MHPNHGAEDIMVQKTVKLALSQREVVPVALPRQRALRSFAIAGVAVVMLTAGAGILIGQSQCAPEPTPVALPENSSSAPVLPSAQHPVVTLAVAEPAAPAPATEASAKPSNLSPQPQQSIPHALHVESLSPGNAQQQEVATEAADLLKMATVLKSEVDKTTKDQLSVTVVRKAGEIEQLAHKVRTGPGKG